MSEIEGFMCMLKSVPAHAADTRAVLQPGVHGWQRQCLSLFCPGSEDGKRQVAKGMLHGQSRVGV